MSRVDRQGRSCPVAPPANTNPNAMERELKDAFSRFVRIALAFKDPVRTARAVESALVEHHGRRMRGTEREAVTTLLEDTTFGLKANAKPTPGQLGRVQTGPGLARLLNRYAPDKSTPRLHVAYDLLIPNGVPEEHLERLIELCVDWHIKRLTQKLKSPSAARAKAYQDVMAMLPRSYYGTRGLWLAAVAPGGNC